MLFLQVDGLGFDTVRRAVRDGDMPTFALWLAQGSHALTEWHCDWSSQTGASVCGILHGRNDDILGFRWYEKDRDHIMACAHPEDAAEIERRHADGRGLLAVDGASRGNLFTGDAPHVSLTMSAVPLLAGSGRRGRRGGAFGAGYYAYFANPYNAVRTLGAAIADIVREITASVGQRRAGVRPRISRGGLYPFARAGTNVIARDVVVAAIIEDMLDGRACVYADFLGYDEVAHHSGIERFDALARAPRDRPADRAALPGHPARAAALPAGRAVRPRADPGRGVHPPVRGVAWRSWSDGCAAGDPPSRSAKREARRPTESWQVGAVFAEAGGGRWRSGCAPGCSAPAPTARAPRPASPAWSPGWRPGWWPSRPGTSRWCRSSSTPAGSSWRRSRRSSPTCCPTLVDHPGVGFALVRSAEFGPVVLGRDGVRRLATDEVLGEDPLAAYGPHAADLVRRVDGFPHCPDVMINSRYDPMTDDASPFEVHVGSHGGMGGPQSRGFLIYPAALPAPDEIVGAEALHRVLRGWLTFLGHADPTEVAESGVRASPVKS